MKSALKYAAYLLLLVVATYLFRQFRAEYSAANAMAATLPTERGETNAVENSAAAASTNSETAGTNLVQAATNSIAGATNVVAATTNAPGATSKPTKAPPTFSEELGRHRSASMGYMAAFVISVILLGGLAAWDVSHSFASRAHEAIFQENEGEERAPEYEAAEQEWSNGNYLEAISQMREYLKANPTEQYVALRIAEIYEKDLGNHVAAAIELEEVLTKRLPREKWGWTAIHLANIYSGRLSKPDQALGLLTRIVEHYPETGAAKKARARLGIPEPDSGAEAAAAEPAEEPAPAPDEANLPKGFRPKK